eukprot:361815-Chlamydomonas_euryale.AAC.2
MYLGFGSMQASLKRFAFALSCVNSSSRTRRSSNGDGGSNVAPPGRAQINPEDQLLVAAVAAVIFSATLEHFRCAARLSERWGRGGGEGGGAGRGGGKET